MPVNWVDGVTPVNAANLETMEADTAAKQAQSEKAQANGYAPLDSTAKVPLVHLPPVSGVDYIGTWGSGIAYKRGDVVRYGSNDYLAVNDSTGVTPPAAYNVPLGGVSVGTSLPASPYDGQEFVLVDSLTVPTYSWRFRYTASITDGYKWVFVGGSEAVAFVETNEGSSGTHTTYQDLATIGPALTVPRAGEYTASWGAAGRSGTLLTLYMGLKVGSAAIATVHEALAYNMLANGNQQVTLTNKLTAAAADLIKTQYKADGNTQHFWQRRWLTLLPRRVA